MGEPFLGRSCAIATGYVYWPMVPEKARAEVIANPTKNTYRSHVKVCCLSRNFVALNIPSPSLVS